MPTELYAGGLEVPEFFGTWRSLNITPDVETGIGGWTDEEIIRAIREGIRPDGERLYPIMPYLLYNRLSDSDAQSVVDYLRTIPAVSKPLERATDLRLPLEVAPRPSGQGPAPGDIGARGEYLTGLMACIDCHTRFIPDGWYDREREYAGGFPMPQIPILGTGILWSANITPHGETGIPHYTEEQIITALTTMQKPDGSPIYGPMMFYQGAWSQMTPDDLQAVAAFIKNLPPVENQVPASTFVPAPPPP